MDGGTGDSDKFGSSASSVTPIESIDDCDIVFIDSGSSDEQSGNVFGQAWEYFDTDVPAPPRQVASISKSDIALKDPSDKAVPCSQAAARPPGLDILVGVAGRANILEKLLVLDFEQDRDSVTVEETETSADCSACAVSASGEEDNPFQDKVDVARIMCPKSNAKPSLFKKVAKRGPVDVDAFVVETGPVDLDTVLGSFVPELDPLHVAQRDRSDLKTGVIKTGSVDPESDIGTGVAEDWMLDERLQPEVVANLLNTTLDTDESKSMDSRITDQQLLLNISNEKSGSSSGKDTSLDSDVSVVVQPGGSRQKEHDVSCAEWSRRLIGSKRRRIYITLFCFIVVLILCAIFLWSALEKSSDPAAIGSNAQFQSPAPSPATLTAEPTIARPSGIVPSISQEPTKVPVVAARQTWLIRSIDSRAVVQDYNGYLWHSDLEFLVASEGQIQYNATNDVCLNGRSTVPENRHDLYCSGRRGILRYEIPVSVGHYTVTLRFLTQKQPEVETIIEGVSRLADADESTSDEPFVVSREVKVADGFMSIQIVLNTVLAGLEIHPLRTSSREEEATYVPGNLVVQEAGLVLSEGLAAKRIATSDERVVYFDGGVSRIDFHVMPDAANTYSDPRPGNAGGWIYVSNSEAQPKNRNDNTDQFPGGVGAITFDSMGNIIDYRMLLEDTRQNCGGGPTPWGAWISGEEYSRGRIWQVDPAGARQPVKITMGELHYGDFESFAYYIASEQEPQFFMTQDNDNGELRRL